MAFSVLVQGLVFLWLGSGVGRRWCNIAYKVISYMAYEVGLVAGVVLQHFVSLHIVVGLLYV